MKYKVGEYVKVCDFEFAMAHPARCFSITDLMVQYCNKEFKIVSAENEYEGYYLEGCVQRSGDYFHFSECWLSPAVKFYKNKLKEFIDGMV